MMVATRFLRTPTPPAACCQCPWPNGPRSARTQGVLYGPPTGRGSERTKMAVVAEINDEADRLLKMVCEAGVPAGPAALARR